MRRTFAGVFGRLEPVERERVERTAPEAVAATGLVPAGEGLVLAVSGPEPQPVDGVLCLLDGFLDNGPELAAELGIADHDPERLVAAAWKRLGEGLLPRLRGDFALLLWDTAAGSGLLARDQLGVRSLVMHDGAGAVRFATDVRELLPLLPTLPGPDPVGVAHWLAVGARSGEGTLHAGVRRLTPGGLIRLRDGRAERELWWQARYRGPRSGTPEELAGEVRHALERAVRRRLPAEGPAGVLLSGGLDSASVAAVAARAAPGRVRGYSGVFPEYPRVDEAPLIDLLEAELGVPVERMTVDAGGGLLQSALDHLAEWGQPLASWGDFWQRGLLERARADGVGVMLGGDGGDEVFGTREYLLADRLRRGRPRAALELARRIPGAGSHPSRRALLTVLRIVAVAGALPGGRRRPQEWLSPDTSRLLREGDPPWAWKRSDGPRWWANTAYLLTTGLEGLGALDHFRRRALSAGLEARHPLLDLDLVELMLELPPELSFDPHIDRPALRGAVEGVLPDAVRLRSGKALFDDLIIDALGADLPAIAGLVGAPDAATAAYVDTPRVRRILLEAAPEDHPRGRFAWAQELWRLTTAECWLRSSRVAS